MERALIDQRHGRRAAPAAPVQAEATPQVVSSFEWAERLRASQERAARRRESLREQQAIQTWLRHLATRRVSVR